MRLVGFFVILIILYIYHPWLAIDKTLSSGDFPYLFLENIKEFSFLPTSGFLWLVPYYQSSAKILVEYIGLSWHLAEKILWFWPFLILSIVSSFYLTKSWLGVLIYTASTYPLMLVGGGQMGVAMAYSLAPLVLLSFMKIIDRGGLLTNNFQFSIFNFQLLWAGLVLALQMMFDPRITYITLIAILLYVILKSNRKNLIINLLLLLITILIALALNSFWIISLIKYGFPSAYEGYSSLLGFQFLSFADFSHSISLLHSNWPENIFGKVYFMQPEFIVLPILAYSSLFFLKHSKSEGSLIKNKDQEEVKQWDNQTVLFFALIGLIGAFLAKGSNPPFEQINEFLFGYFPGMNMFRDPTKFYLLIVLSYSVLIPYTIQNIYNSFQFSNKSKIFNFQNLFLLFNILYLIFLIRPAILGQLGGTFKPRDVPIEYMQLKYFLHNQPNFFKTLWIPQKHRFGFSSYMHPSINAKEFNFEKEDIKTQLKNSDIKYIIVPYDSEKEIFLKDRKYNEKEYIQTIKKIKSLNWIKEISSFQKIGVFEVIY